MAPRPVLHFLGLWVKILQHLLWLIAVMIITIHFKFEKIVEHVLDSKMKILAFHLHSKELREALKKIEKI